MFHASLFRVFTSFILLGLAFVPHTHAHYNSSVWLPPESEPFVPVTDAHRATWDRVVEDCLPLNTRTALSARCMTSIGEYFPNEPLWSYNYVFVYGIGGGWQPLYYTELSQRRWYTPADFLDPNIPYWRDIFDDQIEQRQELFLRVVNDSACQELASHEKQGIHDDLAEQCVAREMYQYAAYLSACLDATQRLTLLQEIATKPNSEGRALNLFELSFHQLDENVADEALRAAAKRHMEKSYLHASWVASHCHEHGLVLRPGVTIPASTLPTGQTFDSYTSTDEKLSWGTHNSAVLHRTHRFIMAIAMKSGDDWAIRGGSLGSTIVGVLGEELMQRYPLLIHRTLGDSNMHGSGIGLYFTKEELAHHRAKAYLLLVEAAGEEFARREYNPETIAKQIQYIEDGGLLKAPLNRAEMQEKLREIIQQQDADKELQEVEGD